MNIDKYKQIFLDLGCSEEQINSIRRYVDLLWLSNEDLNLVSRKMTEQELIENHIIDCLLPLRRIPKDILRVADFGSGGGLPAVLYAICRPEVQFELYEKSPKKQEFLGKCKTIASNIEIHGEIPKILNQVDLVIARGFKPLDVILDVSRDFYLNGGKYFLLKARLEKINEELVLAQKKFKDLKVDIEKITSPVLEVERHLVRLCRQK